MKILKDMSKGDVDMGRITELSTKQMNTMKHAMSCKYIPHSSLLLVSYKHLGYRIYTLNNINMTKILTLVTSTAQLQAKGNFSLISGYE